MPPKRKCSCRDHDELSTSDSPVSSIVSSKKLKKTALNYLKDNNLLQSYHKYLCEGCYMFALNHATTAKYVFNEFCSLIENNDIEQDDFILLSRSYAKLIKIRLRGIKSDYVSKYIEGLLFENLWSDMDVAVREFFLEFCEEAASKNNCAINAYENLVQLASPSYIGPLNFAKTVISYFVTGSRQLVELNAAFSPSGSYVTVLEFLKSKAVNEQKVPELKDCIYFFDNNQIMARNWNVKYDLKPLISVVTTNACLIPPCETELQKNESFIPASWHYLQSINGGENIITENNNLFRGQRNEYINHVISEIMKTNDGPPPQKLRKITVEPVTGRSTSELRAMKDPYDDIPSNVSGKTNVLVLKPIPVNPCSFNSLEIVLDTIVEKSNKTWLAIGCDGLPFYLCSKVIDNIFICPHCGIKFTKTLAFENHIENENINVDLELCKKIKPFYCFLGLDT
ncbi:uncharacterized protein LOC132742292 [Ruditapes philippinarum]|uniref:uncharacterized protein LOC132742292 n=1 Tax=Ruditapes philippinarum TaxID=129788 RepID=UPI00295C3526|nr:uncharacterized protein LOC132742292 [Ruditapes philippinarum]